MKTIHIIENIDERYGGPAQSVPYLCKHLIRLGVEAEIHSVQKYPSENNSVIEDNNIIWVNNKNTVTDILRYSPTLAAGIRQSIISGKTILHTHNQWNYPPYCAYRTMKKYNTPLVCSIRGTLAFNDYKYIKRGLWFCFQKRMLQHASCLHVTKEEDIATIRGLGIKTPIAFIPNGIELEEFSSIASRNDALSALNLSAKKKYVLFLGRVHPLKGIGKLVECWCKLAAQNTDWDLIIAGPTYDCQYLRDLKKTISSYGLENRVHFTGMLNHQERLNAYAVANLFVLPSHSENFGIVIAEALAAGIPVITTHNTPWQDIVKKNCGWWIELRNEKLEATLAEAINTSANELASKGNNGIQLIREKYLWKLQAEKMFRVYQWLLNKADKPKFVYSD